MGGGVKSFFKWFLVYWMGMSAVGTITIGVALWLDDRSIAALLFCVFLFLPMGVFWGVVGVKTAIDNDW